MKESDANQSQSVATNNTKNAQSTTHEEKGLLGGFDPNCLDPWGVFKGGPEIRPTDSFPSEHYDGNGSTNPSKKSQSNKSSLWNKSNSNSNLSSGVHSNNSSLHSNNGRRNDNKENGRSSNGQRKESTGKLDFQNLGIYGRDTEVDILEECWEEVFEDSVARQMLLIAGPAGSGKRKLAETLQDITEREGGIFARGKFDLTMRHRPYSGITRALNQVCQILMKMRLKPDTLRIFNRFCNKINRELGSQLYLLVKLIPSLQNVLDAHVDDGQQTGENERPKPTAKDLTKPAWGQAVEYKQQFNLAVSHFMRIVTQTFPPTVILLEDLHLIDSASVSLMESIMTDSFNSNLLVIGLYCSEDVDETHMFFRAMQELEEKSDNDEFDLATLELENLELDDVHELIQNLLCWDNREKTLPLAEVCFRRTEGNPFFLLELLRMLEKEQRLSYNSLTKSWKWKNDDIEFNTKASSNIVDLLKAKMLSLPSEMVTTIKKAAWMGSIIDVKKLSLVTADTANLDIQKALIEFEASGYIRTAPHLLPDTYEWSHDIFQAAALSTINDWERGSFSRGLGETLLCHLQERDLDANIFEVVNMLNESDYASGSEARLELAKLNLEAAKKVLFFAAYNEVSGYAENGIQLLPKNPWSKHYEIAVDLYSIGAKAEDFLGKDETTEQYCKIVLSLEDRPVQDKFNVYNIWTGNLIKQGRVEEARDVLLAILKKLSCRFPKNPAWVGFHIVTGVHGIRGSTIRSLEKSKMSKMTNKAKIALVGLMEKLFHSMYLLQDTRMLMVCFRQVRWAMKFGYYDSSPVPVATIGVLCAGVTQDMPLATRYGEYALKLLEMTDTTAYTSKTYLPVYSVIFPWTKPLDSLSKPLLQCYNIGMETGDTESATWGIYFSIWFRFMDGASLEPLRSDIMKYSNQMRSLKKMPVSKMSKIFRQAILNLTGVDNVGNSTRLAGQVVTEQDLKQDADDEYQLAFTRTVQGMIYTYMGEHVKQAELVHEHGPEYLFEAHVGSPLLMLDAFLKGLSCFAAASSTGKNKYTKYGDFFLLKVKVWKDMGNPNVKHYYTFLEAECTVLKGKKSDAFKLYEEAITLARERGCQQDIALAYERLGEVHLKRGEES